MLLLYVHNLGKLNILTEACKNSRLQFFCFRKPIAINFIESFVTRLSFFREAPLCNGSHQRSWLGAFESGCLRVFLQFLYHSKCEFVIIFVIANVSLLFLYHGKCRFTIHSSQQVRVYDLFVMEKPRRLPPICTMEAGILPIGNGRTSVAQIPKWFAGFQLCH